MRGRRPGDGDDRGAGLLIRWTRLAAGVGLAAAVGLGSACGGGDGGTGVTLRRLQDAALLAEGNRSRCPLDLELPKAIGGDVTPEPGDLAATGTSVGRAPAGSPLRAVGGAAYRCGYRLGGKPVSLVVVAVAEGQDPPAAAGALTGPVQDAGLDQGAAQGLADSARGAKPGTGVAGPSGSAAAAATSLPGGGAASVAVVAREGGPSAEDLAATAEELAATLAG